MKNIFRIGAIAILALFVIVPVGFMVYQINEIDNYHPKEIQFEAFHFENSDNAIDVKSSFFWGEVAGVDSLVHGHDTSAVYIPAIDTCIDYEFNQSSEMQIQTAGIDFVSILIILSTIVKRILSRGRDFTRETVIPAMDLVSAFRSTLESKSFDALVAAIPGTWDDKLRDSMLKSMATAIKAFNVLQDLSEKAKVNEVIEKYFEWYASQPEIVQNAMNHKMASLISLNRSNLQYKENETDLLVQATYSAAKSKA